MERVERALRRYDASVRVRLDYDGLCFALWCKTGRLGDRAAELYSAGFRSCDEKEVVPFVKQSPKSLFV